MIVSLWNRFWFGQTAGRSEAFFRAAFSTILLCDVLGMTAKVPLLFSNQGVHPVTPIDLFYGVTLVTSLHKIWLLILLGLILGIRTRILGWLNFAMTTYFFSLRGYSALHVADWVHQSMSFCLALMTTDRYLSIERWFDSSSARSRPVSAWPRRIAQLNLASVYFHSGTTKLIDASWMKGTALADTLHSSYLCYFNLSGVLPSHGNLLWTLNYTVILWELLIPFFWLSRKTRLWAVLSSVFFHSGILLLLRVGWFTEVMFSSLLLFVDDLSAPASPDRSQPLENPFKKMAVRFFIFFHLIVFALTQTAYIGKTLSPEGTWWQFHRNLPFPVQFYANHIARLVYFNVWPSPLFLSPMRIVKYRAVTPEGIPAGIPPYAANGADDNGLTELKEARWGILRIRIAKFGLTPAQWDRFLEQLVHMYQKKNHGSCPAGLELWLAEERSTLNGMITKNEDLLKAHVSCEGGHPAFQITYAPGKESLITGPQHTWSRSGSIREWLKWLNSYYNIGV